MDDDIEGVVEKDDKIIIDKNVLSEFRPQNISQGRISLTSNTRDDLGMEENNGTALIAALDEDKGIFLGKIADGTEFDNLVLKDLRG